MNAFLGIDPGKSGGIVVKYPDGQFASYKMGETETVIVECLEDAIKLCNIENWKLTAAIERVGGYIGKGQPGSSMFSFGRNVGVLIGAMIALGIPFTEVTPQTWMKWAGAGTKKSTGLTGTKWKGHLADLARKRCPTVMFSNQCADAVLITEWVSATLH